jgi:hypothetical protein
MGESVRMLAGCVLLLTWLASDRAASSTCDAGFEISEPCVTARGLDGKRAAYERKITEAMARLGARYKIALRLVNRPVDAGYDATVGDVFIEPVRNKEMRDESFVINVTASFLEQQPEILFESSALHEVCHVMNDDLSGYHRNGANTEIAEERCVLQVVGESRYEQYLQAYAAYRHWDRPRYERMLKTVKEVALVPAPTETDEADRLASRYFRRHADGPPHFLVYNGELHDATLRPAGTDATRYDPGVLEAFIAAGKPLIFFHNHPAEGGRAAMFPGGDDFGAAVLLSVAAYAYDPALAVDFRIVRLGEAEDTVVSYGFKGTALREIRELALEYRAAAGREGEVARLEEKRNLLVSSLARDAFDGYLRNVCPVDRSRARMHACRTHPAYFLWPSDRFFIHYRPQ